MPEFTEYAVKHRTSGRFLLLPPRYQVHQETPLESKAWRWEFKAIAEAEVVTHLGSFAGAYEVVPVTPVQEAK